jgi:RNA polymerase sigma-70 factor, ECF subfamily
MLIYLLQYICYLWILIAYKYMEIEEWYDQYLPKIYRYIFYRTGHKQTAEDLTSTVFLKAVSNLKTFKSDKASFSTWLYTIARNTLIDHMRTDKKIFDLEQVFDLASDQNVESETDEAIRLQTLRAEVMKLDEAQREVVIMRVWDELSHREIGEILGISEDNSKMTYSRAVTNLKQAVNRGEII